MSINTTLEEIDKKIARIREAMGDRKCYYPCAQCKGLDTRKLLIETTKMLCRKYGPAEGGYGYHPLISYSLYVFVLIVFVKLSIIVYLLYTIILFIVCNYKDKAS